MDSEVNSVSAEQTEATPYNNLSPAKALFRGENDQASLWPIPQIDA